MTLLKKLQNPYALVVQGFMIGGLFFWTTQSAATQQAPSAPTTVSVLH